jgi:hypothetical protein
MALKEAPPATFIDMLVDAALEEGQWQISSEEILYCPEMPLCL